MEEVIATFSHLARSSNNISQRSGVSVRLSVSNYEIMTANAVRRALRAGETEVAPRVSDLEALAASTSGKVEVEALDDGREGAILEHLVKSAVLQVYKRIATPATVRVEQVNEILAAFETGVIVHAGDDVSSTSLVAMMNEIPALAAVVEVFTGAGASPAVQASAVEFVLEGLHLSKRLNKDASGPRATYRSKA
jgi:magnesium chelatase subunit I